MTLKEVCNLAEETADKFNPEGTAPFPYEKIFEYHEDLEIQYSESIPEDISGAVVKNDGKYFIVVNINKPVNRQYFTIAHELGHYYLHKDLLSAKGGLIDHDDVSTFEGDKILYRYDNKPYEKRETEANNFAASLIMPEKLIRKAWRVTEDIEEMADIFKVSVVAMSIRLERLGLVD